MSKETTERAHILAKHYLLLKKLCIADFDLQSLCAWCQAKSVFSDMNQYNAMHYRKKNLCLGLKVTNEEN